MSIACGVSLTTVAEAAVVIVGELGSVMSAMKT
jgi:hypothetical protein